MWEVSEDVSETGGRELSGRGGFSAGVQEVKRRMAVRRIVLGFVYFILVPSFLIDFGWGRGRENVGTGIGEGHGAAQPRAKRADAELAERLKFSVRKISAAPPADGQKRG